LKPFRARGGIEAKDAGAYNGRIRGAGPRISFSSGTDMNRLSFMAWICLAMAMSPMPGQDKVPVMAIDDPVKDFGKVLQGEILKHVFSFSNRGSGELEVLGIEPSCGCQAASLSAKRIQAGQSGQIEALLDTAGLTGAVDKPIHIVTNDPLRPTVSLSMRADVQPEITVSSPSIYFEGAPQGNEEVSKEILISIPAERSIRILSAESTEESVKVRLEPVPESDGKKIRVIATQKAGGKTGYRMERIDIKTTSYLTPELAIYLIIRNFTR
jgi:hypothetical protein